MVRVILMGLILLNTIVSADMSLGVSVSNAQETTSTIRTKKPKKKVQEGKKFRKDNHRFNKQYRDFDYDRNGYYNNDGLYFGFFNRRGYFFNNIYFEYNSRYNYNDRRNRRGNFEPYNHHYRRYHYYRDNNWNRNHRYREPDEIVYGHYYEERYRPRDDRRDRYIREAYTREERVDNRRDNYREEHSYYRDRDDDRGFFNNNFFDDSREDRYRDNRYRHNNRHNDRYRKPSDSGRVVYHRFSDKKDKHKNQTHTIKDNKSSSSHGRLQISR